MEYLFKRTWWQHAVLWSLLFLGIRISTDYPTEFTPGQVLLDQIVIVVLLLGAAYSNNFWILPFFHRNQPLRGIGLYLLHVAFFVAIHHVVLRFAHQLHCQFTDCTPPMFLIPLKSVLALVVLITFSAMVFRMTRDSLLQQAQDKDAELKLLHSQLNPHFLFNTLNNLFGLAVQKSHKLPELMLQLSDLLRYSIYDTQAERVPLEKEMVYIQNYVALEQIRLEDQTTIEFEKNGDFARHEIAPMLLIVFLENAFKHIGAPKGKRGEVYVSMAMNKGKLIFDCKNSVYRPPNLEMDLPKYHGIGLENVRKRLSLIYPRRHTLTFDHDDQYFSVHLTLSL